MDIDKIKMEWDDDEAGDVMHNKLFNKNKKKAKKTKIKTEMIDEDKPKPVMKLNVAKLSLNITKKLQNILTKPEEETKNENDNSATDATPKKKALRKRTILKSKKPIQKILKQPVPKVKRKLKRLDGKIKPVTTTPPTKKDKTAITNTKIHKPSGLNIANLRTALAKSLEEGEKKEETLRERMLQKINIAKFRYINEQMYTIDGTAAQKLFQEDPDAFMAYHRGYKNQLGKWPINPLDVIISSIEKMSADLVIGDFGCGSAKLMRTVPQKVHSFDLVASYDDVTACDMSHVPLKNNSLDVAVYCLSLMGTNLRDYLFEANRVLKSGGILKIAEVESRFEEIGTDDFIKVLKKYGFKLTWQDLSHNVFYFMDFVKERNVKHKNKLPTLTLKPCLYKKR